MKKVLFSLILLLAIVVSSTAQFEHNKDGEIIPFSLSEKYKHLFDTSKIKTLELPSYNNDSLFWEANFESWYIQNKPRNIVSDNHIIKKNINLKKLAQSYKLGNGTVWLLKIESQTAEALSVFFEEFEFPDGALFSYYSKETELEPIVVTKSSWDEEQPATRYWKLVRSNNMIIEYFEPNGISSTPNIKISKINYHFYSIKKKNYLKDAPKSLKKKYPNFDFEKGCFRR